MSRIIKKTSRSFLVLTIVAMLFVSGFPPSLWFESFEDSNVVDSLYWSIKSSNVIDSGTAHLFLPHIKKALAAQVTYQGAGAGKAIATLGGSLDTAYPTGLQSNDLILLQISIRDITSSIATPNGFALLYGPDSTGTGRQWIYSKISDGTESGNLALTCPAAVTCLSRMYSFRNTDPVDFVENSSFHWNLSVVAQSVTTAGDDRLAVSFNFVNDNNALDAFAGESGGDWTEAAAEFTSSLGSDGAISLQTAPMASAGTIAGGSDNMAAVDPWGVRSFAIIPAASTQVTYQGAGAGKAIATLGGSLDTAYPTGLQSNDLILLQISIRDITSSIATPNGFALLYGPDSTGTGRQWIYSKISDGTESGNLALTCPAAVTCLSRMYSFRNAATSNFTEDTHFESGGTGTSNIRISAAGVKTEDIERMAVSFNFVNDNNALDAFASESDGDWAEAVAEFTSSLGTDGAIGLQTDTLATAGVVSGGFDNMAAGDPWGVRAFALKPVPAFTQSTYRFFENNNSTDVGSALATQGNPATLASAGDAFRLRALIHVSSNNLAQNGQDFKLQFAAQSGSCDTGFSGESYADVTGVTVIAYSTANSPGDGDNLTPNGNDPIGSYTVVNQDYEEANNFTNTVAAIPLGQDGKWDFSLIDNGAPANTAYCLRVVKSAGTVLDSYSAIPQITTAAGGGNSLPVASSVSIDSGASSVTLTEGTTKNVVCAGTVTDSDGFADISSITGDLFRTSVGIGSGLDDNDHYRLAGDSQCIPSGGSGTSETYTCTFPVQYFADPTDSGSPNQGDTWTCTMTPSDGVGAGTAASDTIEIDSLLALFLSTNVSYGSLDPNTDSGASNQTITVTNTGNRDMDPQLSGTDMTCSGNTIVVGQQKYSATAFTYSSGGTALTSSPVTLDLSLPQRTGTAVTDDILWGIGIPNGTPSCASYAGTNTFTATDGI